MKKTVCLLLGITLILVAPVNLLAHCDTMEGPVVKAAKAALGQQDVNLVLIWVQAQDEPEVKSAFEKSLTARKQGKEIQELADQYFFETVVRLHRLGEGESYTGVKPAGAHVCEVIPAADKALDAGSEESLMRIIQEKVNQGVKVLYRNVQEKKARAGQSVEAGREYVEAYTTFMHYVESVFETANLSCEKHAGEFQMLLNKK